MPVRFVEGLGEGWADARGWGVRPHAALGRRAEQARECHVVSLRPGAVRGNHLHPVGTEWMLLMGGPVEVAWREPDEPRIRRRSFDGRPVLVEIPPGTAHAVRSLASSGESFLVAFSDESQPAAERCEPPLLD